jgi:amino acid transporter
MAFATGTEAPSSAIAQLGQVGERGRMAFGRITLWLTLGIVALLTLGFAALALRLNSGMPGPDSTLMAQLAVDAAGRGTLFAIFQLVTALMLLAAANSGFNAGSGLLKALARSETGKAGPGVLPSWLARTNRHHAPYGGLAVFLVVACALVLASRGHAQALVLFYAVAVMLSFLLGLLAMARFSRRERRRGGLWLGLAAAVVVAVTLVLDVVRLYPIVSLAAAGTIAGLLYVQWVRGGRPGGVSEVEALAGGDQASEA